MIDITYSTKEFQEQLFRSLKSKFNEVEKEWSVSKNSRDGYTRNLYAPRIDIAVGPFNISRDSSDVIERAIAENRRFLDKLKDISSFNFYERENSNPRCFITIELENSGNRKHMIGDIANASIIGAVGIIVPLNKEKSKQFCKICEYIKFASAVGKTERNVFRNIVVVEPDKILKVINELN